jgi:hypothetical protein
MTSYAHAQEIVHRFHSFDAPLRIYLYCVVGFGFFGSIFTKSSMAISRDAKRRLRMLYWGATVALAPLLVITLFSQYRGKSMYDIFPDWLIAIGLAGSFSDRTEVLKENRYFQYFDLLQKTLTTICDRV